MFIFVGSGVWLFLSEKAFCRYVVPTVPQCCLLYSPYQFPPVHQTGNCQSVSLSNFRPSIGSAWVLPRNVVTVASELPASSNHSLVLVHSPGIRWQVQSEDLVQVKVKESRVLPGPCYGQEALEYRRTSVLQIIFSWTRPQLFGEYTCASVLWSAQL